MHIVFILISVLRALSCAHFVSFVYLDDVRMQIRVCFLNEWDAHTATKWTYLKRNSNKVYHFLNMGNSTPSFNNKHSIMLLNMHICDGVILHALHIVVWRHFDMAAAITKKIKNKYVFRGTHKLVVYILFYFIARGGSWSVACVGVVSGFICSFHTVVIHLFKLEWTSKYSIKDKKIIIIFVWTLVRWSPPNNNKTKKIIEKPFFSVSKNWNA